MNSVPFSHVTLKDGFWKTKYDMVKNYTVPAVYHRFSETHRFDALRCRWKQEGKYEAHIFWDSDVAKWLEGAAYILRQEKNEELEKIADDTIEKIIENSDENGYFNSYFLVTDQDKRFTDRDKHELYCAGHLMEAAIAYRDATGKDAFLKAMCRYADYIEKVFKTDRSAPYFTPGHPELELALVKLYKATGEKRYLELSKYFIDMHGLENDDQKTFPSIYYNMDDMPLRQRSTAEGHSVRALYLLCGMIDVAMEYGDEELENACRRCFSNIVNKRMYITGGVGSSHWGEAFTEDYHLPPRTAYNETCAAIALALFSDRMQKLEVNSVYGDTVERVIYNGVLSGVSLDGTAFFYENPLEVDPDFNHVNKASANGDHYPSPERVAVFECSCCPPNIVRFLSSVAGLCYTIGEDTVYVNQYMSSDVKEENLRMTVRTAYPSDGEISVVCDTDKKYVALRIPGWCRKFTLNCEYELKNGYAYVKADKDTEIKLSLDMPVTAVSANRRVHDAAGRVAITRGPVVYCAEGKDNGSDLKAVYVDIHGEFKVGKADFLLPSLETAGYMPRESDELYTAADDTETKIPLKLIPYYAFANRGKSEMQVWLLKK